MKKNGRKGKLGAGATIDTKKTERGRKSYQFIISLEGQKKGRHSSDYWFYVDAIMIRFMRVVRVTIFDFQSLNAKNLIGFESSQTSNYQDLKYESSRRLNWSDSRRHLNATQASTPRRQMFSTHSEEVETQRSALFIFDLL